MSYLKPRYASVVIISLSTARVNTEIFYGDWRTCVKFALAWPWCLSYNVKSNINFTINMDINWLIQRLKHGDSYTVQDGDNDPYQVVRPPNNLMIKAADVIVQLSQAVQQAHEVSNNLQNQLNELTQQYEALRNSSSATTPSGKT